MHCGYEVYYLEKFLRFFYINTSVYHNRHHELRVVHYGEMMTIWDKINGTTADDWDDDVFIS